MDEFREAKAAYEATPIPEELGGRVWAGVCQGRASRRRARRRRMLRTAGSFAACLALLVGGLNLFPGFASAAAEVPLLGGLFQVLTVRDYDVVQNQIDYHVSVPEIQTDGDDALVQRVNAEIQERVDAHLEEARQLWEEYREAYLATGGTQEEWDQREMNVIVDYEIKSQTDTTVSFVVNLFQGSFNAYNKLYFYNLDLQEDRDITLADLLGEDWVAICNAAIETQIADSVDEDGFTYFFPPDQGGFTTVDEDTDFYIDQNGTPVVVFPQYAIAAGAAGAVEFPISPEG